MLAKTLRWNALLFLTAAGPAVASAQNPPYWRNPLAVPSGAPEVSRVSAETIPPQDAYARKFLSRRGIGMGLPGARRRRAAAHESVKRQNLPATASWTPLGPAAVLSQSFGLVTGRVTSLALDPSDATGNTLYVGTTGGGVWMAQNAATANPGMVTFAPLTDAPPALSDSSHASISIGALTVQPGGTGVILAGTGDPNDALDSYYGAGILRSANGGKTWTLIGKSQDWQNGFGNQDYGFYGEGFAGFAWSTLNPQLVVAAVSQSAEGELVDAEVPGTSYKGLYYSNDAGATWLLARITDGNGSDVQGARDGYAAGNGSAATAVVWNPLRGVFVAAIRFHGYYQSTDGVTWTRLASQPGTGLTAAMCPTNSMIAGSPACPIFRGVLAVNPLTGDTFAWTVDENNQDQGLWQDVCAASAGTCGNALSFGNQWSTAALESDTLLGAETISNGDYNLALAAVPSGQDTLVLAGGNDLWKCSLAMGCAWRNTTNTSTCRSAQVGPYQHALEWSGSNPLEVFVGNDSGLWRSLDAIGETGSACAGTDASHWQNLNGGLGSLAEVESMSAVGATPYTMLAGLGANGTAGVKSTTRLTENWPEILSGEGGPVAIDPTNANNWFVNNGSGVSIHWCAKAGLCTAADFGSGPAITNADAGNDGLTMTQPAPFLVDPSDPSQLLIGTCRLWRGPASGVGWTAANAVMPMLDGSLGNGSCGGNALIRTMAAMALPGGGELVYVGMYGTTDGGATVAGHVLSATMSAKGAWSSWQDLTFSPVAGDQNPLNVYGLDVSSLSLDPHDASGNTLYVTIAGLSDPALPLTVLYRSTDGGLHWQGIDSNLPWAPANAMVVDPADANTVYAATDAGVYSTQAVGTCANFGVSCWAAYGAGLPLSPAVALSASPAGVSPGVLVAGTYGRGLWQIPLLTNPPMLTTALAVPSTLVFGLQTAGTTSPAQTVTLTNNGSAVLTPTLVTVSGDFVETDNCAQASIPAGASCSVQVVFSPTQAGFRMGQITIAANVSGGSLTVNLSGTGATAGLVQLTPAKIDFGQVAVGTNSAPLQVTVSNSGGTAVPITSMAVSGPFQLTTDSCPANSLPANFDCVLMIEFQAAATGPATGTLTLLDGAGSQLVQLVGTGTSPPTDTLSAVTLSFPATILGQNSAAQTVSITNSGTSPLTSLQVSIAGAYLQSNNCTTQLAAQSSCTVSVQFQPAVEGPQTGMLTVADILRKSPQTVALSGAGLLPPVFQVSPSSVGFAGQQVGTASAPAGLTITNGGEAPMASLGFQITGPGAMSFSFASGTCGATLAAGAACTAQVLFQPVAAGAASATLTVTSSTPGVKPAVVPLSGMGQSASALSAVPGQLTFAATAIGQVSPAQTVTILNSGETAAAGLAVSVSGPFSLSQNACGPTLAGGASCTLGVAFAPMQEGVLAGTLSVQSSSISTATTVGLRGIGGLTGAVQMQPAAVSFSTTGVGLNSNPTTVTITNASPSVALADLMVAVSAGFKLTANTCGASLPAAANCSVGLVFAPASPGTQTGTLSIASSVLAGNATVPLSGTGFDFAAASTGTGSQTVASGQTASYSVMLTPAGGDGSFTFECSSLPSYATCVFNPSTNSVAAGSTGTETVQITTSQASGTAAPLRFMTDWNALSLACGMLLLPVATRKRRCWLASLGVILVAAAGLVSCSSSGGGGGGTPPPTTHTVAPGTYSIPLVVSSNSVQHTVALTLVVD